MRVLADLKTAADQNGGEIPGDYAELIALVSVTMQTTRVPIGLVAQISQCGPLQTMADAIGHGFLLGVKAEQLRRGSVELERLVDLWK